IKNTYGVRTGMYFLSEIDYVFLETLKVTSVDGSPLSWLGRMRLLLEAPGLPTIVLASAEGFEGVTTQEFETNDDLLKPYFEGTHRIFAELDDSTRPRRDVKLRFEAVVTYRVANGAVFRQAPPITYMGY